jgi:transposase
MLSLSPQAAIFIAVSHVDFRLGIDGLAQCCRSVLRMDPMVGTTFVFRNRKRTAIKIITYDGQGYILLYKRFSAGHLNGWPTNASTSQQVLARDLQILFHNGNPTRANMADDWRTVTPSVELSSSPLIDYYPRGHQEHAKIDRALSSD